MKSKVKQLYKKGFDELIQTAKEVKPFETWRIKVDGVYIQTSSGKTAWKKIGHAKNALRVYFEQYEYKARTLLKDLNYYEAKEIIEEIYQQFIEERVEFIRIE